MPVVSLKRRVEALSRDMDPASHLIDLGIQVQGPDRSVLFTAGGIWHKRLSKYVGESPAPRVLRLMASQADAGRLLAKWFADYDGKVQDRLALINCVDARRGGKTHFVVLAMLAFALRYPRSHLGKTAVWIVAPSFPQARELHETITTLLPPEWFRDGLIQYHKSPNYYSLACGSEIWIKSADRPNGLKWGGVSAVAVNEAQQLEARGILNVVYANVDAGGLTILAMNPPDSTRGVWAEELHDAVNALDDKGQPVIDFAAEVRFPPARNAALDQGARSRASKLAEVLDPKAAQRDGLGIWIKLRKVAYPLYNRNQHFRPAPTGWQDITAHAHGLTGFVRKSDQRHVGAGMDWQHRPFCGWVAGKVLLAPDGAWVPRGTPIFVITQEVMNDVSSGEFWDEELLCIRVAEKLEKLGTSTRDYLLVGDATGHNQGASGAQRGKESDPDSWSWSLVQKFGWEVHAPIEESRLVSEGRGSAVVKTAYSNPRTAVRLDLINQLLRANRIIVTPSCPETAESFRTCGLKGRKPFGRGAHLTDAAGYWIYAVERALREHGVVKVDDPQAAD